MGVKNSTSLVIKKWAGREGFLFAGCVCGHWAQNSPTLSLTGGWWRGADVSMGPVQRGPLSFLKVGGSNHLDGHFCRPGFGGLTCGGSCSVFSSIQRWLSPLLLVEPQRGPSSPVRVSAPGPRSILLKQRLLFEAGESLGSIFNPLFFLPQFYLVELNIF